MKKSENLDPFEFGDAVANEYLSDNYMIALASYSIGYIRALHDIKKSEGAKE